MTALLAIIAIILSIVAISKNSNTNSKIYNLEKQLEKIKASGIKTENKTEQESTQAPVLQEPAPSSQNTEQIAFPAEPMPEVKAQPAAVIPAEVKPLQDKQETLPEQSSKPVSIAQVFSWIGGILLVLGAFFTFSYLVQKGIITMPLILSLSALIGMILATVGCVIKDKELQTTASTLCAAGVSICFITAYASYAFFNLIDAGTAFVLMGFTAFASFALSAIKDKQYIGFLALAAAVLTPFLLSTGENKYIFFFVYLLVVNISAVSIAIKRGWNSIIWTAIIAIFIIQSFYPLLKPRSEYLYLLYVVYALAASSVALLKTDKIKESIFTLFGIFTALQIFVLALCINNSNTPFIFFAALFVTVLVLAFEYLRKTNTIEAISLTCWGILYGFYLLKNDTAPIVGFASLLVFAIYWLYPIICKNRFKDGGVQWFASAAAGGMVLTPLYYNIGKFYLKDFFGLLPLLLSLTYFVPSLTFLDREETKKAKAIFIAFAAVFAAMVFPMQFSGKWLTIMLALYACALCWLDTKTENKSFIPLAVFLFATVFMRLLFNPAILEYSASGVKIFNWYLLLFGVSAAAMFASAKFCEKKHLWLNNVLNIAGGILLFALLNIEIADYYSVGGKLHFNLTGEFAEAITYTLAWAISGAILCILSFFGKNKNIAKAGVFLICSGLAKLGLVDIWELDILYRILGVFGMAILLIVVAFLFQKFNKKQEI